MLCHDVALPACLCACVVLLILLLLSAVIAAVGCSCDNSALMALEQHEYDCSGYDEVPHTLRACCCGLLFDVAAYWQYQRLLIVVHPADECFICSYAAVG